MIKQKLRSHHKTKQPRIKQPPQPQDQTSKNLAATTKPKTSSQNVTKNQAATMVLILRIKQPPSDHASHHITKNQAEQPPHDQESTENQSSHHETKNKKNN
jgi:hypothetical protein